MIGRYRKYTELKFAIVCAPRTDPGPFDAFVPHRKSIFASVGRPAFYLSSIVASTERQGIIFHQCLDCFFSSLLKLTPKKISKLRITGPLWGEPPSAGGFFLQRGQSCDSVSLSWRHHEISAILGTRGASGGDHPGMGELIYISSGNYHKGQMFLARELSTTLNMVHIVVGCHDIDCKVEIYVVIP